MDRLDVKTRPRRVSPRLSAASSSGGVACGTAFIETPRGRGHPLAVEALHGQKAHPGEAALRAERVGFPKGGGGPWFDTVHLVKELVPGLGNDGEGGGYSRKTHAIL